MTNVITGTSGDDNLTGTSGVDFFNVYQGGTDTISGLAGNDIINFGPSFTAADTIDGGDGTDTLELKGDYSAGITFNDTTLTSVEQMKLAAGFDYSFTTTDATVATSARLRVDASRLGAANTLTFNGQAEGGGHFYVLGGAGNDVLTGGGNSDVFSLITGGNDHASGEAGNDEFVMGSALTANDRLDGGTGTKDTVELAGNYTGANAVTFAPTTVTNVEFLVFGAGFNYDITTDDATVASGQTLTVDGSALTSDKHFTFDGAPETNGHFHFIGGAGNDVITGGDNSVIGDTFDLTLGGNDTAQGGSGWDTFIMGAALNAGDVLNGGANGGLSTGNDIVTISGDYSAGLVLGANTLQDINFVQMAGGFSYNITENNGNVASGHTLGFDGRALGAGDTLTFNGAAETNGLLLIYGGAGTNIITGDSRGIGVLLPSDVENIVNGGTGSDGITVTDLKTTDQINGGGGNDVMTVAGSSAVTLNGTDFNGFTKLDFQNSGTDTYTVTTTDAAVAAGQTLIVNANPLQMGSVTFDGSAEADGHFTFYTDYAFADYTGGALADLFNIETRLNGGEYTGGGGGDTFTITGATANSHQVFNYGAVSDSTSVNYDTITNFSLSYDKLHVSPIGTVVAVDTPITTGSLSTATFDSDLAADVGALASHHAVLFTADSGTLSGHVFLVVDENGTAGYQAGGDLVIDVTGLHTGTQHLTLALSNFS